MKDDKKYGAFGPVKTGSKGQGDANAKAKGEDDKSSKDLVKAGKPKEEQSKVKQLDDNTVQKDDLTTYRGPGYALK